MTAEEIAKQVNDGIADIKKSMQEYSSKEDLKAIETKMSELETKLNDAQKKEFDALKETINLLKDSIGFSDEEKDALKETLQPLIKKHHAEIVDAVKNKKEFEFEFKAPAPHRTDNGTVTNPAGLAFPLTDNYQYDSEIVRIRVPENFINNFIRSRVVSKVPEQIIKNEEAPKEGAIAIVPEGGTKPLNQYKVVRTTSNREKIAGRIEWTEEFALDFERLLNAFIDMLEVDVIRFWHDHILEQMIANATDYVSSTLDGSLVAPDNALAVIASQSQLQGINFNPDVVFMNPADVTATLYEQKTDGEIKNKPYINIVNGTIAGIKLVTSNKIEQGKFLLGEASTYKEEHSSYIFRVGQYGTQFITNEYTAIGEVFTILSIAELNIPAWIYGDLELIKTALLKPAA